MFICIVVTPCEAVEVSFVDVKSCLLHDDSNTRHHKSPKRMGRIFYSIFVMSRHGQVLNCPRRNAIPSFNCDTLMSRVKGLIGVETAPPRVRSDAVAHRQVHEGRSHELVPPDMSQEGDSQISVQCQMACGHNLNAGRNIYP